MNPRFAISRTQSLSPVLHAMYLVEGLCTLAHYLNINIIQLVMGWMDGVYVYCENNELQCVMIVDP